MILIIQYSRLYLGKFLLKLNKGHLGNASETSKNVLVFVLFVVPSLLGYGYFMRYQTYVTLFEVILNAIGIVFCAVEIGFGLYAFIKISSVEDTI